MKTLTAGDRIHIHSDAGEAPLDVDGRLEYIHGADEPPPLPGFAFDIAKARQACQDLEITNVLWISYEMSVLGTVVFLALQLSDGRYIDLHGHQLQLTPA